MEPLTPEEDARLELADPVRERLSPTSEEAKKPGFSMPFWRRA